MRENNVVEILTKPMVCQYCSLKVPPCGNCKKEFVNYDFYYKLIIEILKSFPDIRIRYVRPAYQIMKIIEDFKQSVGLIETNKVLINIDRIKVDLRCDCGNLWSTWVKNEERVLDYDCRRCGKKAFKIMSKKPGKLQLTEVILEKLPAVIAATER